MIGIVLIDDDKVSTFVTEKFIQKSIKHPYQIFKFSKAKEALTKIEEINPNYLFVDLVMPEMNGLDFLDHLNIDLKSEIYIMSSTLDQRDIEKIKGYSRVKNFLPKIGLKDSISGIFQN